MQTHTHSSRGIEIDPDPWLSIRQAAEELDCHEATLRRQIRAGMLRHARVGVGGKIIRLRRSWLQAAIEVQK